MTAIIGPEPPSAQARSSSHCRPPDQEVHIPRPRRPPKNLALADLEPALDAIAAALRERHLPELYVWTVTYLANELGLGDVTEVGDVED